ncbi:MAG: glycosyltransferase 87 family protein [Solirubrobacteraceae bacterium]|nr:glycosyltransferase 87 family protein [Solirubrobacteraceae bacterium]
MRLRSARQDPLLTAFVVVASILLGLAALREYMSGGAYIAAPDYLAEMLPPINALKKDGFEGYVSLLPGYPGAAMVEYIPVQIAVWLGLSEPATWRLLSGLSVAVLGLAVLWAARLAQGSEASRNAVRLAVLVAAASPAAYWALRIGHPEELLSTGLLLGAVVAAAKERPIIAGVLLGLAVGKAWPAVAAVPVLGLLLPDPVRVAKGMAAAAVAALVIFLPPLFIHSGSVQVMTDLGQSGIFNVGQVFWWFGDPVAKSITDCVASTPGCQSVPQPRGTGPLWSGELSHPLILGVGTALGLVWSWSLHGRLTRVGRIAALRTDGRTRSREETAQLAASALMVMAGILYARCFLDTWNVPYYLLPALVLGALGEALKGRVPILTILATGIMWKWHAPGDLTVRTDPDIYTAFYLSWTIPFGVAFLVEGFKLARGVVLAPGATAGTGVATAGTASATADGRGAAPDIAGALRSDDADTTPSAAASIAATAIAEAAASPRAPGPIGPSPRRSGVDERAAPADEVAKPVDGDATE